MRVVFVSNYINHRQIPFSEAMVKLLGEGNYTFLQTEPMEEERKNMGWGGIDLPSYVRLPYTSPEEEARCRQLVLDSDAVIFGGTEDESWIRPRLERGGFTMRYSERVYKDGQWKCITPRGLKKKFHDHTAFRDKPVYLLCSGAYVASDFRIFRAYTGKMFRWGYFPEFVPEDVDKLMESKSGDGPVRLLWAGRMIDWKHPEKAVEGARFLKEKKIPFHLNFIGGGPLEGALQELVKQYGLSGEVTFLGFREPAQVREEMRSSDVLLFTSDRREGWGAVANEAMNSGCVVLADAMIGAVPYLIRSGWNGAVYSKERWGYGPWRRSLYEEWLEKLARDRKTREFLARNAYATIAEKWNAQHAAENLIRLMEDLMDEKKESVSEMKEADKSVKITDDFIAEPTSREIPLQENRIRKNAMRGLKE